MYIFILYQRERKRHCVVCKARHCVLRFLVVDHFILGGRSLWVSKHHPDYVRGEICFKEIVSNTRLDLNHSSFMHLICEFLIICRFLLIYTVSIYCVCLLHLFVLLLIFRFVCCFFYFITKVNHWNISNNHFLNKKKKSKSPLTSCIPNSIKISISLIVFLSSHNTTTIHSLLSSLEMLRNDKKIETHSNSACVY